ncbi:MAG TPA: SPOR domain-containing protein [Bacteroidales bacterium]|nr:SPOR domain-containing protein [Bacteroidales bacterium]
MIIKNIIRFLEHEEELMINGLGCFSKKTVASKVDGDIITPPKVTLHFESNENGNGFPFVDKISKWESIRLLDADEAINKWVAELKTAVQNNKSVSFDNFGAFSLNPQGKMVFESDMIKELNGAFYGMNPVPIVKSDRITIEPKPEEQPVDVIPPEPETIQVQDEMIQEQPETNQEQPETNQEQPEEEIIITPKRKSRWLERFLFMIIILGSLALVGYLFRKEITGFVQKTFQKKEEVKLDAQEPQIPLSTTNEIIPVTDDLSTDVSTDQTPVPVQPAQVEPPVVPSAKPVSNNTPIVNPVQTGDYRSVSIESGKFYVIAGSFVKKEDAIQHIKDKKLDRYNPILVVGQSRVRVCIGTFNTESEATAFAEKIDKTYWILK